VNGGEWRHGTDNGYTNHGCRCYWCKQARAVYAKDLWVESQGHFEDLVAMGVAGTRGS
jgi:hypothetical protein